MLDRIYVSHPGYDNVRVVTATVKTDHKAVIAYSGPEKCVLNKRRQRRVFRKRSSTQHALFLEHISELSSLYDSSISDFGAAWRKAERRILNIPPDTHNYLIPLLLNNALPFLEEVCKRSARFVFSCIHLDSSLFRSIAKHGIFESCCNSVIGKNAAFFTLTFWLVTC